MAITAAMVKELRELTGSGMMDCKKALTECAGDIEAAVKWLREKGQSKAEKKAGRVAAEGIVSQFLCSCGRKGAIAEVNIETDFAAKNEDFRTFASDIAEQIVKKAPYTVAEDGCCEADKALVNQPFIRNEAKTVEQARIDLVAVIGENVKIRRFERYELEEGSYGVVSGYIHGEGRVGVLIELTTETEAAEKSEAVKELAYNLAMQIAAMKPRWVCEHCVPEDILANEKDIIKNQALNEGKPEKIIEKMIGGRIKKFFAENCLLDQEYIRDDSKKCRKLLEEVGSELGSKIKVSRFVRYELGEGIEKKVDNFAEEVMAQLG